MESTSSRQDVATENTLDLDGNPSGGYVRGVGVTIDWLSRPASEGEADGVTIETLLHVCKERLEWFQEAAVGKFACVENTLAIAHIEWAVQALESRTARREKQVIEGTHTPDPKA